MKNLKEKYQSFVDSLDKSHQIQTTAALEFMEHINFDELIIADIGAGPGHQAHIMTKEGAHVICVDPIEPLPDYDLEWASPAIFCKRYNEDLDAIWSHHTLEHIRNPIEALECWAKVLKPEGKIYLAVPKIDGVISTGHINSFDHAILTYQLAIAGFDCSEAQYFQRDSHSRIIAKKATEEKMERMEGIPKTYLRDLAVAGFFNESITEEILLTNRFTGESIILS